MKADFTLNLDEGTLKPNYCFNCGFLICSCADEPRKVEIKSEIVKFNKEAIRKAFPPKADLPRFPLKD